MKPTRAPKISTVEETLIAMRNAARAAYPESVFARGHGYDMELQTDQRTVEDLASELGKFGEFELNYDPTDPDPYEANWTCTLKGRAFAASIAFGGYCAIEAMQSAIEYATEQSITP